MVNAPPKESVIISFVRQGQWMNVVKFKSGKKIKTTILNNEKIISLFLFIYLFGLISLKIIHLIHMLTFTALIHYTR